MYKFVCDPDALFNMAYGPHNGNGDVSIKPSIKSSIPSENPENLCLKQQIPPHQSQHFSDSKTHHHSSSSLYHSNESKPLYHTSHQNYDIFPTFYNANYGQGFGGIPAGIHQYLAPGSGHFVGAAVAAPQGEYGALGGQHVYQGDGEHNWNIRYYQNQLGYDG